MSDQNPKIWIDQYDLNIGVRGGDKDQLGDVREHFDELLAEAVERDPKLDEETAGNRGVQ